MKLLPIILTHIPSGSGANSLLSFYWGAKNPTISGLVTTGAVTVVSYVGGVKIVETYPAGTTSISVQADAGTKINILGSVTEYNPSPGVCEVEEIIINSNALTRLVLNKNSTQFTYLTVVDIKNGIGLTYIEITELPYLQKITLRNLLNLQTLRLSPTRFISTLDLDCPALTSLTYTLGSMTTLDLSKCPALTSLYVSSSAIKDIIYPSPNLISSITLAASEMRVVDLSSFNSLENIENITANAAESIIFPESLAGLKKFSINKINGLIKSIDLNEASGLTRFSFSDPAIESVDLSTNNSLTGFSCGTTSNPTNIRLLKIRLNEPNVTSGVSNAINGSTVSNGVIYLNDQDTYYSTVAPIATTKGWTIEAL